MRSAAFRAAVRTSIHRALELTGDDTETLALEDPWMAKAAFVHYQQALRGHRIEAEREAKTKLGKPVVRVGRR